VFVAAFRVYPVRGAFAILALAVSALFMLRVVQRTFYGPKNETFAHLADVSFSLAIPRMLLVTVLIVFGLFPFLLLDVIETASVAFLQGLL